jgi:hypothetical protein
MTTYLLELHFRRVLRLSDKPLFDLSDVQRKRIESDQIPAFTANTCRTPTFQNFDAAPRTRPGDWVKAGSIF